MRFRRHYRGTLSPSASREAIQTLRRCFHKQLKILWSIGQLDGYADIIGFHPKKGLNSILEEAGPFRFAPVVTEKLYLVAELDVLLLRPASPGALIGHGGDLDNRMKILLDALRVPSTGELPKGDSPEAGEEPFFCLLQDDALVTQFSVTTDRLLEDEVPKSHVLMVIQVDVSATRTVWDNLGIA